MYSIGLDGQDVCVALGVDLPSIAASVVDLPLPVGPVTSTSPRAIRQRADDRRQTQLAERPDGLGISRTRIASTALVEDVATKTGEQRDRGRRVAADWRS
jgi:hypothetical protein